MRLLFVTGSDAAFFPSLLICLQSFSERIAGQKILVCDYGLTDAQREFLRNLELLLDRPHDLNPSNDVFYRKAALLRYLRHNSHNIEDYDAVIWIDGDLTLMKVGIEDFRAVVAEMREVGANVAACSEPTGQSIGQLIELFSPPSAMQPFARLVEQTGVSPLLPYFSSGLFFCRSGAILSHWDDLATSLDRHPLFEQNAFNVALHCDGAPVLTLDCEAWQAQGTSLDAVRLCPSAGERPSAFVGDKNIKTLHTTSPHPGHLAILQGNLLVSYVELPGIFKLFAAEQLRLHQLELLALFVITHSELLLRLGICRRSSQVCNGFQFSGRP